MKDSWPELKEGTPTERVKTFTRLLQDEIITIRTVFKNAPDFVQYALADMVRARMTDELYKFRSPHPDNEDYVEWAKDEAMHWLSKRLWIETLNTGGIK